MCCKRYGEVLAARRLGMLSSMPGPLQVTPRLVLPEAELSWRFSRSSGPGGQSVNTSDSRAELSFDVARSPSLSEHQRERAAAHRDLRQDADVHVVDDAAIGSRTTIGMPRVCSWNRVKVASPCESGKDRSSSTTSKLPLARHASPADN